jgi:hypothetical protein
MVGLVVVLHGEQYFGTQGNGSIRQDSGTIARRIDVCLDTDRLL